jgi:uncharacterized membrane protein YcfT
MATDAAETPRERTVWADVAKGVCILLVVLWHVIIKHYLQIDWRLSAPLPGAWGALGEQLLPLRMPLFFTISGMFAAGAVARPWRVLGRSKVAKFGYLYALWLLVHTAILAFTPEFDTARASGPLELVEQLTITPSNLWYFYALAMYFTIAKAVRRLPTPVVLAAAFALSAAAAAGVLATPGNRGGLYQNLFFFLAGLYFRPVVGKLAASAGWRRLVLTGGAYAVVLAAMAVTGARSWPGVWPAASAVATVFGVMAAAMVARWTAVAGVLAAIGRRTLPIYVLHMPLLALLHRFTVKPLSTVDGRWEVALAVAEPVLMVAVVAALCLLLHRTLERVGGRWLFDLPTRRPRLRLVPRPAPGPIPAEDGRPGSGEPLRRAAA